MLAFIVFGCNSKSDAPASGTADSTKTAAAGTEELNYPYKLSKPYQDWQPGDKKHAVTAMGSLKGFETNDMAACMAGFADSIDVRLDGLQQKFSKDSLTKFFTAERSRYANMRIDMGDWESVVSKDGKTEYVTMWYKQVWTDKAGKTDSLAVVDDCKMVNGKIAELDEKVQRFQAKK